VACGCGVAGWVGVVAGIVSAERCVVVVAIIGMVEDGHAMLRAYG